MYSTPHTDGFRLVMRRTGRGDIIVVVMKDRVFVFSGGGCRKEYFPVKLKLALYQVCFVTRTRDDAVRTKV